MKKFRINSICAVFLCLLLLIPAHSNAENTKSRNIFEQKMASAEKGHFSGKGIGELIASFGKSFIGTEYEANSLDSEPEALNVHLEGLDCYTFLEASCALAVSFRDGVRDYDGFKEKVKSLRYRDGKIDNYHSRLHYFSDWLFEQQKCGRIKLMAKSMGGEKYSRKISFMSSKHSKYAALRRHPEEIPKMKAIENEINSRDLYYIPAEDLKSKMDLIQEGDLIGITTDIEGLDIVHVGIAVIGSDGRIHFMHAPNVGLKVQISAKPLCDYLSRKNHQTGIMIARFN